MFPQIRSLRGTIITEVAFEWLLPYTRNMKEQRINLIDQVAGETMFHSYFKFYVEDTEQTTRRVDVSTLGSCGSFQRQQIKAY